MTQVSTRKIAVPLAGGGLSMHFGQSSAFAVFEVEGAKIVGQTVLPLGGEHACGMSEWLKERGVGAVIVGGLGRGALLHMSAAGLEVYAGIPGQAPEAQVQACLEGKLPMAAATCAGHEHGHGEGHGHGDGHGHGHGCHAQPATGQP